MRPMARWVLAAAIAGLLLLPASAVAAGRCGAHPWCDTSLSPDARASLLVGQMTNDEKAAFLGGDDVSGVAGGGGAHTRPPPGGARPGLPTTLYSDRPPGSPAGPAAAQP